MDSNSLYDLKRLEEQIFQYKPNIKSSEKKKYVRERLRNQLQSKAVVKIQRMDAECESLMISLKQRLLLLQDFLLPKKKNEVVQKSEDMSEERDDFKLNLSSESSDDESMSSLMPNSNDAKTNETQCADPPESDDLNLPLALRRNSRERRLSCKSYSSVSTTHAKANRNKVHSKQENTVTTSGVVFQSEEVLVEQEEVDTTPTLHIKIPSLHRGNVHYIVLDSLNFARKVFDYRANEVKQQHQQKAIYSKISKQHKKQLKCNRAPALQQFTPEEQDLELSQFIQDVMAEPSNDETLQATNALESINNNQSDNYDFIENDSFINYSQSSEVFSYSQNSSEISKVRKKCRKNNKRSNGQQNEPPRKRGRKPKKKNDIDTEQLQPQPPTKSNLAQYVELFSNDCGLLPGSSTPAASSTRSQPLVSSTTQNFEVVDNISQMQEHQSSPQDPITYYIDGDWANGGPCQLVTTNRLSIDGNQLNQENAAVQNFINFIDNNGHSHNDIIATVLECNNNMPISIPQSLTNFTVQNKNNNHHQLLQQSVADENSLLPIINIQIPTLPNNIGSSNPPLAHFHKEVIDLSIKSNTSVNNITTEPFNFIDQSNVNFETYQLKEDEQSSPLDLSIRNSVTIDSQDEDFIRRLIEDSDFDYRPEELKKICDNENSLYENDNNKLLKTALDMPLLEFDARGLTQLVENAVTTTNEQRNFLTDEIDYNGNKNNEDVNYVSMGAVESSIANNLHFADQSSEIFNKLMDICPDNQFLHDVNDAFLANDDFQCRVENSTMLEVEKQTTQRNQLSDDIGKVHSKTLLDNHEIENTSSSEPSSTSLAVQLDISDINNLKLTQEMNLNDEICNNAQQLPMIESKDVVTEIENSNIVSTSNGSDDKNTSDSKSLNDELEQDVENVIVSKALKSPITNYEKNVDIDKCLDYSSNNTNKSKASSAEIIETKFNNKDIYDINDTLAFKENFIDTGTSSENSHLQSKQNVVFSVAKITLSDDGNLYNTSSDSSSEKSCDLRELKKTVDYDNIKTKFLSSNLTTDKIEGEQPSVLNLCKNVEKQQNTDQEKLLNIDENLNCAKVQDEVNVQLMLDDTNNTLHEKLSPLELEAKLESPLDFDEDFDDALSLATSFLDSPNDDRFEDSIVDNNNTTIATATSQDLKQNEMCRTNSSQDKNLKHFKIPKLNNSADSIILSNKSEELKKVEDSSIKISVTKTQNLEKVTRTVINDLVQFNTDANVISEIKYFENEETTAEILTVKVFGVSCLPFLVDQCDGATRCQLSHQLNDTEKLYRNLNSLDKIQANLAYQILYNHTKLYKMYFNIFCTYYTNRNDRTKLLNMANDCERYPECAEFIISIYEGLVKCGLSRANACRIILKCIREKKVSTSIVEVLVTIIMKSDWTMFTDFIEKYTQDMYQFNFRICILEQMAPAVLNSRGPHLKQVFGKCVQTLHRDDTALLLNSPILIQCVSLLTTNT